jgi:hypothetical protein
MRHSMAKADSMISLMGNLNMPELPFKHNNSK